MINTNYGQNNKISLSLDMQQKLQDRQVFEQFLSKPGHVTCDSPRGHLVKENPFQMFTSTFVDVAKDSKNLAEALVSGNSNDHELGRMNDLGMKIGGGLIAAALMGSKATSNKKLMEVFGFGTFFSVMSLWPKVAVDIPTKLRYGFNPHQKYIDSQGRKKQFFQDNQYLPWDVWSKEDINKIADKMKVPCDLKDREEYTKEKMRTIALQDNTLWMLTAGFATPLLTSLACNRIEEGIRVPVANHGLKKLTSEAASFDELTKNVLSDSRLFKQQDEAVGNIVASLRKGVMPENMAETLGEVFDLGRFAENNSVQLRRSGAKDAADFIARVFPTSDSFDNLAKAIAGEDGDDAVREAKKLLSDAYTEAQAGLNGKKPTVKSVISCARGIMDDDIGAYQQKRWARLLYDDASLPADVKKLIEGGTGYDKSTLEEGAKTLEEVYTNSIKPAQAQVRVFGSKLKALDNISGEKYNKVARQAVKALGFTDSEIKVLRNSSEAYGSRVQDTIAGKITEIAADDSKYEAVMKNLSKTQAKIETAKMKDGSKTSIKSVFDSFVEKLTGGFRSAGSKITSDALDGSSLKQTLEAGLNENEIGVARSNITSVEAMITKFKKAIELERQIKDGTLLQDWGKYAQANNYKSALQAMEPDELEGFYNLCRRTVWQTTYGDAVNKAYVDGNGKFFKTLTDTVFGGNSSDLEVLDWQGKAKEMMQGEYCIPNTGLEVIDGSGLKSHALRFADFGESITGMVQKQVRSIYNDRTWMKTFGGLALALVGVTFVSQLFFGKVKDEHLYEKRNPDNDKFVKQEQ